MNAPSTEPGLEGKTAVVTGGGRGIGRNIAERLLDAGVRVLVTSRSEGDLAETIRLLSPRGAISALPCDVADSGAVQAVFDHAVERYGTIDILVCSHGVHAAGHSVLDFPLELWQTTLAINLTGVFLCSQAASRVMVDRGNGGRIIVISSTAALASVAHECAYDSSKGGVEALTRAMALDLAPHGITVNSVAPAWIRTPMVPPEYLTETFARALNPTGRLGEPSDVSGAVLWLADPATSYVTGATIVVDGGQQAALGNPATLQATTLTAEANDD